MLSSITVFSIILFFDECMLSNFLLKTTKIRYNRFEGKKKKSTGRANVSNNKSINSSGYFNEYAEYHLLRHQF